MNKRARCTKKGLNSAQCICTICNSCHGRPRWLSCSRRPDLFVHHLVHLKRGYCMSEWPVRANHAGALWRPRSWALRYAFRTECTGRRFEQRWKAKGKRTGKWSNAKCRHNLNATEPPGFAKIPSAALKNAFQWKHVQSETLCTDRCSQIS